jgi:hypothetical protein
MHELARELRDSGYERTERESPFHDDGTLWTNSYELICDRTLSVIRKNHNKRVITYDTDWRDDFERHEYYNSEKTRMMGGYFSAYDW